MNSTKRIPANSRSTATSKAATAKRKPAKPAKRHVVKASRPAKANPPVESLRPINPGDERFYGPPNPLIPQLLARKPTFAEMAGACTISAKSQSDDAFLYSLNDQDYDALMAHRLESAAEVLLSIGKEPAIAEVETDEIADYRDAAEVFQRPVTAAEMIAEIKDHISNFGDNEPNTLVIQFRFNAIAQFIRRFAHLVPAEIVRVDREFAPEAPAPAVVA